MPLSLPGCGRRKALVTSSPFVSTTTVVMSGPPRAWPPPVSSLTLILPSLTRPRSFPSPVIKRARARAVLPVPQVGSMLPVRTPAGEDGPHRCPLWAGELSKSENEGWEKRPEPFSVIPASFQGIDRASKFVREEITNRCLLFFGSRSTICGFQVSSILSSLLTVDTVALACHLESL